MDCSICSSMPFILRPPRNTICAACYEGTKSVITIMNKLKADKTNDKIITSFASSANSSKPLANLPKWMNNMKETEEEQTEKINFVGGFVAFFRERILTDIQLKPGNGPSISAHRAILAARSKIFKNMLDSDSCKAPANDTISFSELNEEELDSLLVFLYSGSLPTEKLEKHLYSLTLAADKYEITYLLRYCEKHMLRYMDSSNALEILEISDICSNKTLKETTLNFIVRNMEDIAFSAKYEAFVKNPHLAVNIIRAFFMDAKSSRTN